MGRNNQIKIFDLIEKLNIWGASQDVREGQDNDWYLKLGGGDIFIFKDLPVTESGM